MRLVLCFGFLVVAALPAAAQREYDTRNLTCGAANALIQQRGAIIMTIGPNQFDRFVSEIGFCDRTEQLRVRKVTAADTDDCGIRWVCFRPKRDSN